MDRRIKIIIFDWGRTLHEPESDTLFDGVLDLLRDLSKKFSLVLVTLAKSELPESRKKKIENSGVAPFFKLILSGGDNKDEMYEKVLVDLGVDPKDVAIIDDRTIRGIAWGNRRGALTVWLQKGKFSGEIPNEQTGMPSFTIKDIREVRDIFKETNLI